MTFQTSHRIISPLHSRQTSYTSKNKTSFSSYDRQANHQWKMSVLPNFMPISRFVGSDNPETYFKDTERTRVVRTLVSLDNLTLPSCLRHYLDHHRHNHHHHHHLHHHNKKKAVFLRITAVPQLIAFLELSPPFDRNIWNNRLPRIISPPPPKKKALVIFSIFYPLPVQLKGSPIQQVWSVTIQALNIKSRNQNWNT